LEWWMTGNLFFKVFIGFVRLTQRRRNVKSGMRIWKMRPSQGNLLFIVIMVRNAISVYLFNKLYRGWKKNLNIGILDPARKILDSWEIFWEKKKKEKGEKGNFYDFPTNFRMQKIFPKISQCLSPLISLS